jgi:uncharacterized protein (DUF1330 family)
MAAYVLAESLEVTDPDTMAQYGKLARESIAQYGGKVLAAGPPETVEGDWKPNRLVLIEFDSMDKLKTWYDSPEYQAALPLRLRSARENLVRFNGL